MIVEGREGAKVGVFVDERSRDLIRIFVKDEDGVAAALLDGNHAEALETAIRAARLELQARAVSL